MGRPDTPEQIRWNRMVVVEVNGLTTSAHGGVPMRTCLLFRSVVAAALVSVALAGGASALEVGQKAPDFALNGVDGKPVKLSDLTAKGPVVIYTFIAAFPPT